jgi:hypothetical protein
MASFVSALFADRILKRLWKLTIAFLICPKTSGSEAPRQQGGASRKGNFILIVPLDPAYIAGLAGHSPVSREGRW